MYLLDIVECIYFPCNLSRPVAFHIADALSATGLLDVNRVRTGLRQSSGIYTGAMADVTTIKPLNRDEEA
ncbi:hypothetical protein AB0L10_44485, partial [Streptomyces flaveolus]|uniref:hypothetical protein n=1 Tax=Streptomyces flaveolus TaxID=67297 RepID=UPI00342EDC93